MNKLPFAKPVRRAAEKARGDREEARVVQRVRAACVERDGYCRLAWATAIATCPIDECEGPSEWAHLEGHRRFETRGMEPDARHATTWTTMLCKRHHESYDAHDFYVEPIVDARGADGPLRLKIGTRCYREVE